MIGWRLFWQEKCKFGKFQKNFLSQNCNSRRHVMPRHALSARAVEEGIYTRV